jgi:hypothetical protein
VFPAAGQELSIDSVDNIDLLQSLQLHNTSHQGVTETPGPQRLKPAYSLQGEYMSSTIQRPTDSCDIPRVSHCTRSQLHSLQICLNYFNQKIRTANESFENVATFKYLETLTNQIDIHDEIKSRLNSGNACYYSVQNFCLPVSYQKP